MNIHTDFFKIAILSKNFFIYFKCIILQLFIVGSMLFVTSISVSIAGQLDAVWYKFPGWAKDIAVMDSNYIYVIGTGRSPGGYGIHRWLWPNWRRVNGGGIRIEIGGEGLPWIVNSDNMIFQLSNRSWKRQPGWARDIGVGGDGSIWVIGTNPVSGGYGIFKWNYGTLRWDRFNGGAVRIAANSYGEPWIVNTSNMIFRWRTGSPIFSEKARWEQVPGSARDIAIGRNGSVWIIGTDPTDGGYSIYRWNWQTWDKVNGGAVEISVDDRGLPWIVDSIGAIFQCQGLSFQ